MKTYLSKLSIWTLALGLTAGLVSCGSKNNEPNTPKPTPTPAPTPTPTPKAKSFDWATCDVLIKEGHDHGHGNLHGNNVRKGLLYPQEQRFTLRNEGGGKVSVIWEDKLKTMPYFQAHQGGALFALLFEFKDAQGKPVNQALTDLAEHYQIFFTLSDRDDKGNPFEVQDFRTDKSMIWDHFTKAKPSIPVGTPEEKIQAMLVYTYRDTKDPYYQMKGDGDAKEHLLRVPGTDNINHIGMKGHFKFLDRDRDWDGKKSGNQLPNFYLKVSLKHTKGSKFYNDGSKGRISSEFYKPEASITWSTVFEFLLPVRVIANKKDQFHNSDRYWNDMAKAFGKTPKEMQENEDSAEPSNDNSSFHL